MEETGSCYCFMRSKENGLLYERKGQFKGLFVVMVITASMMCIEIIAGILTNSLALLADALHMLTDFFSLFLSFFAILVATRRSSSGFSYGFWRVEVLAALINSLLLFPVVGYIIYEAISRFSAPKQILTLPMLFTALAGLIANIVGVFILKKREKSSINVRSAFIHLIGDTLSSIAVVIGAISIAITKIYIIDPIISIGVALLILIWTICLLFKSIKILLEGTPEHIEPLLVKEKLLEIPDIKGVHDMHIWELTSGIYAMTAHIEIMDLPLSGTKSIAEVLSKCLNNNFGISHVNFQFEAKRMEA